MTGVQGLLINGAPGVGKSTCLRSLSAALDARGVAWAVIDLDYLTLCGPRQPNDPYGFETAVTNLALVASTYRALGTEYLCVGHVFTEVVQIEEIRAALGIPSSPVVRLRADAATVQSRLRARHTTDATHELDHFLADHSRLEAALDLADLDDKVIDVGQRTPEEVAALVLVAAGWTG